MVAEGMDRLHYVSTEQFFGGIIVEVHDANVVIDLKGRLGQLNIPRRMIISEYELQVGQEVGFLMTYPEVLEAEPCEHYVKARQIHQARMLEKQKERGKKA